MRSRIAGQDPNRLTGSLIKADKAGFLRMSDVNKFKGEVNMGLFCGVAKICAVFVG